MITSAIDITLLTAFLLTGPGILIDLKTKPYIRIQPMTVILAVAWFLLALLVYNKSGGGGANPKHAGICHLGMGKSGEKWGKLKTSKFMFRKNFFINYSS